MEEPPQPKASIGSSGISTKSFFDENLDRMLDEILANSNYSPEEEGSPRKNSSIIYEKGSSVTTPSPKKPLNKTEEWMKNELISRRLVISPTGRQYIAIKNPYASDEITMERRDHYAELQPNFQRKKHSWKHDSDHSHTKSYKKQAPIVDDVRIQRSRSRTPHKDRRQEYNINIHIEEKRYNDRSHRKCDKRRNEGYKKNLPQYGERSKTRIGRRQPQEDCLHKQAELNSGRRDQKKLPFLHHSAERIKIERSPPEHKHEPSSQFHNERHSPPKYIESPKSERDSRIRDYNQQTTPFRHGSASDYGHAEELRSHAYPPENHQQHPRNATRSRTPIDPHFSRIRSRSPNYRKNLHDVDDRSTRQPVPSRSPEYSGYYAENIDDRQNRRELSEQQMSPRPRSIDYSHSVQTEEIHNREFPLRLRENHHYPHERLESTQVHRREFDRQELRNNTGGFHHERYSRSPVPETQFKRERSESFGRDMQDTSAQVFDGRAHYERVLENYDLYIPTARSPEESAEDDLRARLNRTRPRIYSADPNVDLRLALFSRDENQFGESLNLREKWSKSPTPFDIRNENECRSPARPSYSRSPPKPNRRHTEEIVRRNSPHFPKVPSPKYIAAVEPRPPKRFTKKGPVFGGKGVKYWTTVLFANFPETATEKDVYNLFKKFGAISKVQIQKHGRGHVNFNTQISAKRALTLNNLMYRGKRVRIFFLSNKPREREGYSVTIHFKGQLSEEEIYDCLMSAGHIDYVWIKRQQRLLYAVCNFKDKDSVSRAVKIEYIGRKPILVAKYKE